MISWSPLLSCSLLQLLRRFGVNLAVLEQMLVREELLSTAIHRADVALMQGQFILRVEAHRTALDVARVPFDAHWIISWSPLLSCGFLQLLHHFGSSLGQASTQRQMHNRSSRCTTGARRRWLITEKRTKHVHDLLMCRRHFQHTHTHTLVDFVLI